MNLFDYVKMYGDKNFYEKDFNEIDNLVFSLISYLDFTHTDVNDENLTLEEVGGQYLSIFSYSDIKKIGRAQKDAYKLLKILIEKNRYKNVYLSDYVYKISNETQFSACTFKLRDDLYFICFEGTDEVVSGWKEDGKLACIFPVPAQKEAIKYVNKTIKIFGPNFIIGGHSKGGNLALVSGMYTKWYKRGKIKTIYSNDGPGLREKEFNSKEFKKIKDKYIHIIPEYSVFGVLLKNDNNKVIKSTKSNIFCHSISTWIVNKDKLVCGNLSIKSKRLENSIDTFLSTHTDLEKIRIVKSIFKVFEDASITHLTNATSIKNILKILHNIGNIDKDSKKLIIDLFMYSFKYVSDVDLKNYFTDK